MSVARDLARNRRVFELLTGVFAEPEGPADSPAFAGGGWNPPGAPEGARPESAGRPIPADNPETPRFSLKYGSMPETGMALSFEAPGGMKYPELIGSGAVVPPDPLESLYRRLETEARMTSQLSGEEEF